MAWKMRKQRGVRSQSRMEALEVFEVSLLIRQNRYVWHVAAMSRTSMNALHASKRLIATKGTMPPISNTISKFAQGIESPAVL